MSSLLINSILNNSKLNGTISEYNSNAKKVFQPFVREQCFLLRRLQLFLDNLNFKYSGEEFVSQIFANDYNESILKKFGFKRTIQEEYPLSEYNYVIEAYNVFEPGYNIEREKLSFYNGLETVSLEAFFDEDTFWFNNSSDNKTYFTCSFVDGTKIYDFFLKEGFLHFLIKKEDEFYYILSHIGLNFKKEKINFSELDCFSKIKIGFFEAPSFIKVESGEITIFDSYFFKKIIFGKRSYFELSGIFYFTKIDAAFELNDRKIAEDLQLEFLFLYDLVALFGLSDFTKDNKKIISSKIATSIDFFTKKQFSNTLNGLLNFADLNTQKSYFIDFKDDFISISDNIILKEKGDYKLKIFIKKRNNFNDVLSIRLKLFKFGIDSFEILEEKSYNVSSSFVYYKNLKISINALNKKEYQCEIDFSLNDDYSVERNIIQKSLKNDYVNNLKNYSLKRNETVFSPVNYKTPLVFNNDGSLINELNYKINTIKDDTCIIPLSNKKEEKNVFFKKVLENKEVFKIQRTKFRIDFSDEVI